MKKLCVRLVFLLIAVSIAVAALTPVGLQDDDDLSKRYAQMPERLQIACTGDSHPLRAFAFKESGYTGFSFALSSQSLMMDYQLIDAYIDRFQQDAVLILNMSYYTPWVDDRDDPQRQADIMRYLGVLDSDHIPFDRKIDYLMNRYAPILTWADRKILTVFRANTAQMDEEDVAQSGLDLATIGQKRAAYHRRHVFDADGAMRPVNEEYLRYVDKIVALAAAHGVSCVLLTTPYTTYYSDGFRDVLPAFEETVGALASRLHIPFLDYSRDTRFTSDDSLFADSDHLNDEGARLFTAQVIADLQEMGYLS